MKAAVWYGQKDIRVEEIDRICYLIAHHHTYYNVDGLDYRILLEEDTHTDMFFLCWLRQQSQSTQTVLYEHSYHSNLTYYHHRGCPKARVG